MIKFRSGYFDRENRKYIITDMQPVRPLVNYIWNEEFMMNVEHNGGGFSFAKVGYDQRRSVVSGEGSRLIYIKDRETGEYFCANKPYSKQPHDVHEAHVQAGVSTVIGEKLGIRATLTLTVPLTGFAELWQVEVENRSDRVRSLSVYGHAFLDADFTGHRSYNTFAWDRQVGGLVFEHGAYDAPHEYIDVFFCADQPIHSYTTSETTFRGHYRTFAEPVGVEAESLPNNDSSYDDYPAAALELRMELAAGEKRVLHFVVGTSRTKDEAAQMTRAFLAPGFFDGVLTARREKAAAAEDVFTLHTNNAYLDDMITHWLKNQIDLGKTWARVYGKGFRDVMQDVAAFASFDPATAREKILLCLSHQFPNGNTIRMFEPFLRHPYVDGAAWIPETVAVYLNESGNTDFLYEECPYFESDATGTVLDHIRRGMTFLITQTGAHGLCLWGGGDWNDSINAAGMQGKGESVWLSIATVKALKKFAEILRHIGELDEAQMWLSEAEKMTQAVRQHGWDGDHYLYGYTDYAEKVGSNENAEGQIYLNAQTWAVLSGIAAGEDGHKLMDTVEARLHCAYGYMQCAPSYTKGDPHIGRASYFLPGCCENGSVYNHGVTFKIAADCYLGRGGHAYRTIREILPSNPELQGSGVEPYAMTNMYIGPENPYCPKFAPCFWITGTAGWMYRCVTEYLLGVNAEFTGLRLTPCIPPELDGAKISRRYRGATYNITIHCGVKKLLCDGQPIDGDILPLYPAGTTHTVEVWC